MRRSRSVHFGSGFVQNCQKAYELFKENITNFSTYWFYEMDYLQEQFPRVKYVVESGETFVEMEGAETKDGEWTIKYGSDPEDDSESGESEWV